MARILLVDDDASILEAYQLLLEAEGHTVVTAANGVEAFTILVDRINPRDMGTDLLITDLQMPRLDGLGLIKIVRESSIPVIRDLLAILISGGYLEETQRVGIEAGADMVLPKPCDYLVAAVNRLLRR